MSDQLTDTARANGPDSARMYLYLVAYNDACVQVKIPGLAYHQSLQISKDSVRVVKLPSIPLIYTFRPEDLGITVRSSAPLGVYHGTASYPSQFSHQVIRRSTNAATLISNGQYQADTLPFFYPQGSHTYHYFPGNNIPFFIQSLADSNRIALHYFRSTANNISGFNFNPNPNFNPGPRDTVILHKGQFYVFEIYSLDLWPEISFPNQAYAYSLNDKALKATGFNEHNNVLIDTARSHRSMTRERKKQRRTGWAWEETPPMRLRDTLFYLPRFRGYQGSTLSIMASKDSTKVFLNGQYGFSLYARQRLDTSFSEEMLIRTNKPVTCYATSWPVYNRDSSASFVPPNGVSWSSFSVTLSSAGKAIQEALVPTLTRDSNVIQVLSLVTPTRDTSLLKINGAPPTGAQFHPFSGDSSMSYINVPVPQGLHRITSPTGFTGYGYTYAPYDSTHPEGGYANLAYVIPEYGSIPENQLRPQYGSHQNHLRPSNALPGGSLVICPGDTVYFNAGALRNIKWRYLLNDSLFQPITLGQDGKLKALVLNQPGTYRLKLMDTAQCSFPDSIDIEVQGGAFPAIKKEIVRKCAYRLLRLSVPEGASGTYQWRLPGQGTKAGKAAAQELKPNQRKLSFQLIRLINGCADTLHQEISLNDSLSLAPDLVLPNVITPNGDGINDALCFEAFQDLENCFELSVYNRIGRQVFHSFQPGQCWQAREVPAGVYYYILRYQDQKVKKFIHVLR